MIPTQLARDLSDNVHGWHHLGTAIATVRVGAWLSGSHSCYPSQTRVTDLVRMRSTKDLRDALRCFGHFEMEGE